MKILTRTAYGALLQVVELLNVPFVLVPNTTLNEKYEIQAGVAPAPGKVPALNYYAIGNGGHANLTGADGFPYTTPIQHLSTDAALYKGLPFILRPLGQDLDPTTMQQYALRKIITAPSGTQYIAYYLKRLNIASSGVEPTMSLNTTTNGVTSTQPFVPTGANLNPTPPPVNGSGVVTTNGSYITSSAIINIDFNANDVAELINVCQILFGNELYAVISEIGLCSGVDQLVTIAANGQQPALTYNEAIAVQIMTHVTSYYSVGSSNQGVEIDIQVGATEPLYGATNVTTSLYTPTATP